MNRQLETGKPMQAKAHHCPPKDSELMYRCVCEGHGRDFAARITDSGGDRVVRV